MLGDGLTAPSVLEARNGSDARSATQRSWTWLHSLVWAFEQKFSILPL